MSNKEDDYRERVQGIIARYKETLDKISSNHE